MDKRIEKYMPKYVSLYYVDYDSNLDNSMDVLQKCLSENCLFPLSEHVLDWWDNPEEYYMDEIKKEMQKDGAEELFDEYFDEIRDYLYEHDDSTPVDDLLRNTSRISCYYSLGVEVDGWHSAFMCTPWRGESEAKAAYKIRRRLGIEKGTPNAEKIDSIVANASYGGELRIYFNGDIPSLISGDEYCNAEDKKEFRQIRFNGKVALALYNPSEGSGDFEYIEIDKTFPFLRDNLIISESDRYSLEDCFGMCGDWLDKCVQPFLTIEPMKKKGAIKKSKMGDVIKREKELDAVFKAGGCTAGDMNMKRHRDVYYDNRVPCGSHCPHCGTFWID